MTLNFMHVMQDGKQERTLRYFLHKDLSHVQPGRSPKTVHASDVTKEEGFCPREFVLIRMLKKEPKKNFINTSTRMTFDIGNYVHNRAIESFARQNRAIGNWECIICGAFYKFCRRPNKCDSCNRHAFKYKEVVFISEYSGISGSTDLIVDLGFPLFRIVEIKSIDKDEFKSLVAPYSEHKIRTSLYLRLIDESNSEYKKKINTKTALVLYISKGGFGCKDPYIEELVSEGKLKDGKLSPFKEYEVHRDDAMTDPYVQKGKLVNDFDLGKASVPAGVCPNSICKRATYCPVVKECFSGNYA